MKTPKLTKARYETLSLSERFNAFCRHPLNLVFVHLRPDGLSRTAQADLTNDWQGALYRFYERLPAR